MWRRVRPDRARSHASAIANCDDAAHSHPRADCGAANGHAGPFTHAFTAYTNCDCDRDPRANAVTHCHRNAGADTNPRART